MRITALVENTTSSKALPAEHGLSLYIETGGKRILFDMGQTELFYENAKRLGIDLSLVDIAILSHGHYDHGGGLRKFLQINSHAPVYLRREAFLPHYNGSEKYIGLDSSLIDERRLIFCADGQKIDGGATLYGSLPSREHYLGAFGLKEKIGECFVDDDFRHEQYLLLTEGARRVLISGCSHRGVVDIALCFRPDVLVGGFHLSKLSIGDERLQSAADILSSLDTEFFTCHCTGEAQYEFMKETMKRLHYLSTGESIEI